MNEITTLVNCLVSKLANLKDGDYFTRREVRALFTKHWPEIVEAILKEEHPLLEEAINFRDGIIADKEDEIQNLKKRINELSSERSVEDRAIDDLADAKLKDILQAIIDERYEIW
jgi:hypothetical protein